MEQKHYYAFISHSSEDEKMAKWLCRQLEGYHIPTAIQKEYHAPKSLKPIFLFQTDLSGNKLRDALDGELRDSQFLIVICSPSAAKSDYVNGEVQHFIDSGRYDKIIPFIIDGTPFASLNGNAEEECFPPALVALKGTEKELRGIDLREEQKHRGSKKAAVIDMIATMLGVRMDMLWDRYKRHQIRQYTMFVGFALLLLLSGLLWMFLKNRQLMENQARAVAEKALNLINEGDSRTAQRILLEVLPKDINNPFDRPFVIEAEAALRKATYCNSRLLDKKIPNSTCAVVSPNGKHIAYQTRLHQMYDCSGIYDVDTRQLNTLMLGLYNINATFSPMGDKVAFFSEFGADIKIFDVNTFERLEWCKVDPIWFPSPYIFSPQGDKIVYYQDSIAIVEDFILDYQVCSLDKSSEIAVKDLLVNNPYFSPDGKEIISSFGDKIVVWDSQTGKILRSFDTPSMLPSFSPDGRNIIYTYITISENEIAAQSINIIDAQTGMEIKTFPAPHSTSCAFYSPKGKWIAIFSHLEDSDVNKIGIYDALTGDSITTICTYLNIPTMCSFTPDDRQFIYTAQDNTIHIYDLIFPYESLSWNTHKNSLNSVRYSPDGNIAVTFSDDGYIVLWDVTTGHEKMRFRHNKNNLTDVSFCPSDPNVLVSCSSKDSTILIWDILHNQVVDSLIGHSDAVNSVRFSSNGKYLISASNDCDVIVWDFLTRTIRQIIKGSKTESPILFRELTDEKLCAELSPNGKDVAILSKKSLIIKDIVSGDTIQIFHASDSVFSVNSIFKDASFNHKGDLIVSASDDNTIRIWNIETGHQISEMSGHKGVVNSVSFSPNDKYIISISTDGSVKIWDVATSIELCTYMFEHTFINSADFSPDEEKVIFALSNGMIKIFDFPTIQELIDSTRECFKDNPLTPEERRKYYLE